MNTYNTAAIQASLAAVKSDHPDLYGLLVELAEELESAYIDPDSTLASPAAAMIAGLKG